MTKTEIELWKSDFINYLTALKNLINKMPYKGDSSTDSSTDSLKIYLSSILKSLEHAFNEIRDDDFDNFTKDK